MTTISLGAKKFGTDLGMKAPAKRSMTSLTTIFGMVPLLFSFDMGSELQKPLSIAMISAMLIGTAVSLFIIPLVYWFIYRKHDPNAVIPQKQTEV